MPGQKIANVVKKLSQEHHAHTSNQPSTTASNNREKADEVEDKSTRRSLDAVVAKLHIVKKQEFDKQFQVDLGSVKQVRENTKLDSVVEKLVAKQSQSQLCDYPVHFETLPNKSIKTDTVMDSSMHCMEADVSSTVPDIFEIGMQRRSTVMAPSDIKNAFQSIADKDTDKPIIIFGFADGEQGKMQRESASNVVTRQGMQMKLPIRPKIVKVETAHSVTNSGVKSGGIQLRNEDQADIKEGDMATNSLCLPTKLPEGIPITFEAPSSQHKQMLAKVNKFIIETFNVKPKVLECLPGKDDSRETLNDSMCGSLTDFYAVNSTVCVLQESSVPDATFVKLFQVNLISSLASQPLMLSCHCLMIQVIMIFCILYK